MYNPFTRPAGLRGAGHPVMRMNAANGSMSGSGFGRCAVLVVLVASLSLSLACSQTKGGPVLTPEAVGARPMNRVEAFEPDLREAVQAATAELLRKGDEVEEFYAEVRKAPEGQIVLQVWHTAAFQPQNRDMHGNPGGKCRTMFFDPGAHKITQELRWQ